MSISRRLQWGRRRRQSAFKDALQDQIESTSTGLLKTVSVDQTNHVELHSMDVHTTKALDSLFSQPSVNRDYRGFVHLVCLLLAVTLLRLAMENYRKYGVLLSIPAGQVSIDDWMSSFVVLCIIGIFGLLSFLIEVMGFGVWIATIGNVGSLFAVITFYVWSRIRHPMLGTTLLCLLSVVALKLLSFHLVMHEMRRLDLFDHDDISLAESHGSLVDPDTGSLVKKKRINSVDTKSRDVTVKWRHFMYFITAPTLCYQTSYARSGPIRWKKVFNWSIQLMIALGVIHLITEQYAKPTLDTYIENMNDIDPVGLLERVLKFSISSILVWLLGFYALFHCFLNVIGELCSFGDRTFYRDWWNAASIADYWRLWNIPVHLWFKRHIHRPLVHQCHWNPIASQICIFVISAIMHEYLIAIPTHLFEGYALLAMLMQIPLLIITAVLVTTVNRRQIKESTSSNSSDVSVDLAKVVLSPHALHVTRTMGNVLFWIFFCIIGQPLCVMLYYRAYTIRSW